MTISYILRKNVQPAGFQSEFIDVFVRYNLICNVVNNLLQIFIYFFANSDLLGPSTAAYVIVVLLDLTIIVDGWFTFISYYFSSLI